MTFKVDKGGRRRYIGQSRRGKPSKLKIAAISFGHAIEGLQRSAAGVELAADADLSDGERERVLNDVRGLAKLAQRFTREALKALGPGKAPKVTAQTKFRWR